MPAKPGSKQPKYRHHKPTDRAVVTLVDAVTTRRRDVWLGKHGTPESRAKYYRVIGEWEARDRRLDPPKTKTVRPAGGVSVRAVVKAYGKHIEALVVEQHYRAIDLALNMLIDECGDTSAAELGPLRVKSVRLAMVGRGWSRSTINRSIRFIVAMTKWAQSEELIPVEVYTRLDAIPNLRSGELGVSDGKPVLPVPEGAIGAIREHLSSVLLAMIDLQLVTGARPGEVCTMRATDLDTSGEVWSYKPEQHKGKFRGKGREILLGPKAIEIIRPFMQGRKIDAPLFSPREANAERKARGVGRREGQKPTPTRTDRTIGEAYATDSYRRAIHRACDQASIDRWSPHQLRHTAATVMRREYGLEAAALLLGHSNAQVTAEHYAEADRDALLAIVRKTG